MNKDKDVVPSNNEQNDKLSPKEKRSLMNKIGCFMGSIILMTFGTLSYGLVVEIINPESKLLDQFGDVMDFVFATMGIISVFMVAYIMTTAGDIKEMIEFLKSFFNNKN